MVHKTHIKRTFSVHMVNFQQKISSWLISNVSIRFILSQNYFFWTRNVDLAPLADSREVAGFLPLTKKQEYELTICTVHVDGFFAPKLDWNLTNLGRMYWIPEKTDRKNAWVLLLSLLLHAPTSPDRISKWPWSRAMCMAMQIFGLVRSNAGCQWIIENFLNF